MKSAKKVLSILLASALVLSMAACGGSGGGDSASTSDQGQGGDYPKMSIRVGGTVPDDHPITQAIYKFKDIVEKESGGNIQVQVFANGQLGAGREMEEAIQLGNVDMGESTLGAFSGFTDEYTMLSLPFLFKNRESAYAFMDSDFAKQMSDNVEAKTGIKVLGYWENGFRMLTNSKHPVTKPEDLEGMKIRVMESPIYIKMFTAMGASPTPMALGELYTALQQKTIDGQDNPYTLTVTNKFYEIQKYMTNLEHTFDITGFQANADWYNGLDDKTRALIDKAVAEATTFEREKSIEAEQKNRQVILDAGVQLTELTDEQRQAFKDKCGSVYDWFRKECKPISDFDEFLAAVKACEK